MVFNSNVAEDTIINTLVEKLVHVFNPAPLGRKKDESDLQQVTLESISPWRFFSGAERWKHDCLRLEW